METMRYGSLVLYSGVLKFSEVREDQVVFIGTGGGMKWGDDEGNREIANSEFVVDKKYWENLGSPDEIAFGFSTGEGWEDNWNMKPAKTEDDNGK